MRTFDSTARTHRAVCFLSHGQKCETWLPAGRFNVVGDCWLDSVNQIPAVMLRDDCGATWYVHPSVVHGRKS